MEERLLLMIIEHSTRITTKGQVTIPADVRRLLGVRPHDRITFVVEADQVRLTPATRGIVARTAGALKGEEPRVSSREEKLAAEEAIAAEVEQRS